MVNKIVLGSALAKRNGVPTQFWEFMQQAKLDNMPLELKNAYLKVVSDPAALQVMHDKDVKRMLGFKDISDAQLSSIKSPALIINGDRDVILPEHALQLHRLLAGSELAVLPGTHGEYIGEITTLQSNSNQTVFVVQMIERFLKKR
jgi:pimeloyl-ACP methyl ester carboxylesterase